MILHLTPTQMLEQWRLHRGLHPLANGLSVTAASNTPLDTLMMSEIEAWYQRLLTDGPEERNDPVEYSANIHLPSTLAGEGVTFQLPENAVRLLAVRLTGWQCDARIITDPRSPEALRQLDPYTRATLSAPVAVVHPGGFVTLWPSTGDNIPAAQPAGTTCITLTKPPCRGRVVGLAEIVGIVGLVFLFELVELYQPEKLPLTFNL